MKYWSLTEKLSLGLIVLILALLFIYPAFYVSAKDTVTFTVTDKERVHHYKGSSYYLVFTDGEVFKNDDQWYLGKFRSSDLQGQLKEGKTYRANVCGWRIPLLSEYRNIISAEEVAQ